MGTALSRGSGNSTRRPRQTKRHGIIKRHDAWGPAGGSSDGPTGADIASASTSSNASRCCHFTDHPKQLQHQHQHQDHTSHPRHHDANDDGSGSGIGGVGGSDKVDGMASEYVRSASHASIRKGGTRTGRSGSGRVTTLRLKVGKRIGSGSSGDVFVAQNKDTGELLAVKEVRLPSSSQASRSKRVTQLQRELSTLRLLRHPHVLNFRGSETRSRKLCIYTEYLPGGSVQDAIRAFGTFEERLASRYTRHLLKALAYVHRKRLVHCDVKCANLLLDHNGRAKLADFGDTIAVDKHGWVVHGSRSLRGTPRYLAPEIATGTHNGTPRDVWAVGCCLVYMLSGSAPWRHVPIHDVQKLMAFISTTHMTPLRPRDASRLSADAVDFLRLCFTRNPVHRPTAQSLLRHDFIRRFARDDLALLSVAIHSDETQATGPSTTSTTASSTSCASASTAAASVASAAVRAELKPPGTPDHVETPHQPLRSSASVGSRLRGQFKSSNSAASFNSALSPPTNSTMSTRRLRGATSTRGSTSAAAVGMYRSRDSLSSVMSYASSLSVRTKNSVCNTRVSFRSHDLREMRSRHLRASTRGDEDDDDDTLLLSDTDRKTPTRRRSHCMRPRPVQVSTQELLRRGGADDDDDDDGSYLASDTDAETPTHRGSSPAMGHTTTPTTPKVSFPPFVQ